MVFEKLKDLLGGEEGEKKPERVERLSIEEVRKRLKERRRRSIQETEKNVQPLLEKISNIRGKIEDLSDSLATAESSEEVHPNIYKSAREAQRLLLRKVDRATGGIKIPSESNWEELLDFNRSLQDVNNLLKNATVSHGSQVAILFGSKVDRLKRLTDGLKSLSKELNTSLRKRNLKLEKLDGLLEDISERENLLEREENLRGGIEELKDRKQEIQESYAKTKSSLESLKRSQRFEELEEIKQKRKELARQRKKIRKKIDSTISDLARPIRKMDKLIERNEHMVSREVLDALDSYLDNPVQAALSEEEGLPKFNAMLQELEGLLEGKMKLSNRERRKRLEEVQDIIENRKVAGFRGKYFQIENKQEELEEERKSSPLLEKKNRLEGSMRDKESELNGVKGKIEESESKLSRIEGQIKSKSEKIREAAKSILEVEIKEI